jgi:uncharacterized protein with FMN-binding domain
MVPANKQPVNPKPAKKTSGRKLAGGLLALGSSAVVSVYTLGYVSTQSSINDLSQQVAATASPAPSNQTVVTPRSAPTATPSTSAATAGYQDGTYTGTGNSRHGSITVSVVIKNGEITSASVSDCRTRYPCSDINPLISAVLTNQKVPTNHVSGATDSSTAYKSAVKAALQKALVGV